MAEAQENTGLKQRRTFYRTILFEQGGKCFVCQIEEWRILRGLQMHRLVPGKHGGGYVRSNVILVCHKCHRRCEGMSFNEIKAIAVFFRGPNV